MNRQRSIIIATIALFILPQIASSFAIARPDSESNEYSFIMSPGNKTSKKLDVFNTEKTEITMSLYGADSAPSKQGSFAVKTKSEPQNNVGQWVQFDQSTYTIPAGESITVNYIIQIPNNVAPGTYAGGLVGELVSANQTDEEGKSRTSIGVVTAARYALPLYINIPGEKVYDYEWSDFEYSFSGYPTFTLHIKNTGNTILRASGNITINDTNKTTQNIALQSNPTNIETPAEGEKKMFPITLELTNIEIQQGQELKIPIKWKENVPLYGNFTATAKVEFSEFDILQGKNINPETVTKTVQFQIIPWALIIKIITAIAVITFIIVLFILVKHILFNYKRKNSTSYTVKQGDTIQTIAQKNNIKWTKIAKINRITPPYELTPNTKILLPIKKS